MPTEEGMVFPPPANEPESPVYLPAFSSKVPQRWIYSPVISLEMEMSDKVLRNGRYTSEVASATSGFFLNEVSIFAKTKVLFSLK